MEIPYDLLIQVFGEGQKPLFVINNHFQSRGFSENDPAEILGVFTDVHSANEVMMALASEGEEVSGYMCFLDGDEGLCRLLLNGSLLLRKEE